MSIIVVCTVHTIHTRQNLKGALFNLNEHNIMHYYIYIQSSMRFKIYLSLINLPQVNTKSSVKTYTASHFVSGLDRELGDTQCDIAGLFK